MPRRPRSGSSRTARRGAARRGPETTRDLAGAERLARRRFGVTLRPEQREAIGSLLRGRDVLCVLPTGYGKSLIYQVPALLSDRPTIVVSPLIALMADQAAALARRGAPVVRIDGSLRAAERREALERFRRGGRLIVLTTPESLQSSTLRDAFMTARPWLLCVDEAHCISEWGHDFRPAYLRLGSERKSLGGPVALALTATATPRVQEDIVQRLGLRNPAVQVASPHRANLRLEVEVVTSASKPERVARHLQRLARPAIVYCSTTATVERLAATLIRARIASAAYHGRMPRAEREASQRRFLRPRTSLVMVATSAFGMGIDKPDIRTILHYQTPGSLEQYVQEAGRAGRDGRPARCVLFFDPDDLAIQTHLQNQGRARPAQVRRVARALGAWAGEDRPVDVADLALSAGVPRTVAQSVCAQLEEVGVLERDARRRYTVRVAQRALLRRADDLGRHLEVRARRDAERLLELDRYAHALECRSAFLRRYFGEASPPACGKCDVCRPTGPGRSRRRRGARRRRPA